MSQITPEQLQALLGYVSKQVGMTPEQLAQTVQSGNLEGISHKLSPDIAAIAGDRRKMEQLVNSPQAQALLQQLLGGN